MQTMVQKQTHNHFHHCGGLIIRKWDDELEYYYICCPQCNEVLNQDDYPELMRDIYKIEHNVIKETTLITETLSKCAHDFVFWYEDERAKMNIYRCECGQIVREKR